MIVKDLTHTQVHFQCKKSLLQVAETLLLYKRLCAVSIGLYAEALDTMVIQAQLADLAFAGALWKDQIPLPAAGLSAAASYGRRRRKRKEPAILPARCATFNHWCVS